MLANEMLSVFQRAAYSPQYDCKMVMRLVASVYVSVLFVL